MNDTSQLCSVYDLREQLDAPNIRVIDCSWYLPSQQINTRNDYMQAHIPGAVFFDIDEVCDRSSKLPHMLPSARQFGETLGSLGIANHHKIIVYDTAGIFSCARVWWMLRVFGHSDVQVLQGGLPEWRNLGFTLTSDSVSLSAETFNARLDKRLLADKELVEQCVSDRRHIVVDARSEARYKGSAPEPRAGLSSGHIPHSLSLQFDRVLDGRCMRPVSELQGLFSEVGLNGEIPIITSCGSGVTAAILTLALCEAGFGMQKLYDGAWAEWASLPDAVIWKT